MPTKSQWPPNYQQDSRTVSHEPESQRSLVIYSENVLNEEMFYIILVEQETSEVI